MAGGDNAEQEARCASSVLPAKSTLRRSLATFWNSRSVADGVVDGDVGVVDKAVEGLAVSLVVLTAAISGSDGSSVSLELIREWPDEATAVFDERITHEAELVRASFFDVHAREECRRTTAASRPGGRWPCWPRAGRRRT